MKKPKKSKSIIAWGTPADVSAIKKNGQCSFGPEKWFKTDRKYRITRVG